MPASSDTSEPAALCLALLGGSAALHRAGRAPVALSRFDAALLAVLALAGATPRQRLLQLLWPDQAPAGARNALRQRLFRLRRAAGSDVVQGSEQLALADAVQHDLGADAGTGELLGGYDYADCPALQEWLDAQRRTLQLRRNARRAERIAACEREGRHAEGAALAEAWVAAEPLHEPALRQLMQLHHLAGHGAAALAAYDRFSAALAHEHPSATPARETTELLQTIRHAREVPPAAPRRDIPASVLRPPRLVGRDGALAALRAAWSGRRVFWLLGEAGLGKSRLLDEFVAQAFEACGAGPLRSDPTAEEPPAWGGPAPAAQAALVIAARPGDSGVPYASLGRALRALIERQPALLEQVGRGELARVVPELALATIAAPGLQMALQRAVLALLRGAQRGGVTAIVFDDLHFADPASLEMLQALVCDDALAPLHWGFAQRPAEGAAACSALREALEESQRVDLAALQPLDEAQMHELIRSLGLPTLDADRLAPMLTRHTGGNPMYALETVKHLLAHGGAVDAKLPRPASVGQLIERRLRALSPQALQLARVAAVAGIDFSIELAERVLDTRALALADAWQELEAAQVLRGCAFAHDLVHEATLAGVPAPIAAHTHGAVAAWLEEHGGAPARIASHWIDALQPRRALRALHAAADAAKGAMRRKEEAAFLSRAAQIESESDDHDAAFASLRAMIEAALVVDLKAVDAAAFDRLDAEATTDGRRAEARTLRSSWLTYRGDLGAAKRLACEAIELADAAGDEPTAADARMQLAQLLDWNSEWDAALALLQPLLPWAAERAGDDQRLAFYNRLSMLLDNTGRGREARVYHQRLIDLARSRREWGFAVTYIVNLAVSWTMSGHMRHAIDVLRDALRLAAAHDEAHGGTGAASIVMYSCLRDCGRYAEALHWLEPALADEAGQFTAVARCQFACGWVHLGQHARAQQEIDAALQLEVPPWIRAKALQMRARVGLALGRRSGALLDEALAIMAARPGRTGLRASIVLDHALTLEPVAALAAARAIIATGEQLDLAGTMLAGHIRAARFAADAASASAAALHADAALAIGDDIAPNDLYPAERWLNAWRAFRLARRDADAATALERGVAWVRATSRDHVPEPFRDSFVRANAVNQQLLRAATAARAAT